MEKKLNNYDDIDMEEAAIKVIKILLGGNVPMEDIMQLSGKDEKFINEIKESLKEE